MARKVNRGKVFEELVGRFERVMKKKKDDADGAVQGLIQAVNKARRDGNRYLGLARAASLEVTAMAATAATALVEIQRAMDRAEGLVEDGLLEEFEESVADFDRWEFALVRQCDLMNGHADEFCKGRYGRSILEGRQRPRNRKGG